MTGALIALALCWHFGLSPWIWLLVGMYMMEKMCAKDDDN